MAALTDSARLVYIGLWTLCDDAGFFEYDVSEIAVALFPRESERKGERRIEDALVRLVAAERVEILPCGLHALVPKLPDHRQTGGETLYTIRKRHESRCLRRTTKSTTEPTTENEVPDSFSDSSSSSDSLNARTREAKKRPGESFADWSARVAGRVAASVR